MPFDRRRLVSWAAGVVLAAGLAVAGPAPSQATQLGAEIEVAVDQIAVYADTVVNFDSMDVRISDPDGNLVVEIRSLGDPVTWGPSAEDPDGLYRYEVVVTSVSPAGAGQFVSRQRGAFEVIGGAIVVAAD